MKEGLSVKELQQEHDRCSCTLGNKNLWFKVMKRYLTTLCAFSVWTEMFYFKLISKLWIIRMISVVVSRIITRSSQYFAPRTVSLSEKREDDQLNAASFWSDTNNTTCHSRGIMYEAQTDGQHGPELSPDAVTAAHSTETHTHTHTFLVSCMWCFCRDDLHVALMWRPDGERYVPHWLP